MKILIFIFYTSFLLSYLLFYPSLALSRVFGAIDLPDDRKIHSLPMPRCGGFAIFVAFTVIIILSPVGSSLKIPLSLGGATVFLIGFLDDSTNVSPFIKLSGQFLAISVYYFTLELSNYDIIPFHGIMGAFWMMIFTNAVNLTDGLDGLAGGICAGEALCLATLAFILKNNSVFLCSVLLLGVILGFLPRNFPRAKIFMGDCGALFLGFTLSALSSKLIMENEGAMLPISVVFIFFVPVCEVISSVIRRANKRKNPFEADKGHFHHLLLEQGFTKECSALLLIALSLFCGLFGVVISLIQG